MQRSCRNIRNSALGFAGALMMVTACSSTQVAPYPARWPPLSTLSMLDCATVTGRYSDNGENAEPSLARFTLILFGFQSPWPDATEVSLQVDEDTIHVTIFGAQNVLLAKSFTAAAGDYTCDAGVVVLHTRTKAVGEGVSGDQTATLRLLPQQDGYLVVHAAAIIGGWQMVIPATWSTDSWARFSKVDPSMES